MRLAVNQEVEGSSPSEGVGDQPICYRPLKQDRLVCCFIGLQYNMVVSQGQALHLSFQSYGVAGQS